MRIHSRITAIAAICFASCTVTEFANEQGIIEDNSGGEIKTVIKASISDTRTTLGTPSEGVYPVLWQAGDIISVNGAESEALTSADIDGQSADFSFTTEVASPYMAVYPASAVKGYASSKTKIGVPENQQYVEDSFDPAAAILLGTGNSSIDFTSAMAFLKIRTSGSAEIAKVVVTALGTEKMSGDFVTTDFAAIAPDADGTSSAEVSMIPASPVDAGATFIIAIPAQSYASGFMVTLQDPDGGVMQAKSEKSFSAVAGHIYAFTIAFEPVAPLKVSFTTAPVDGTAISINHSKGLYAEAIAISWSAEVVGAEYNVAMSLSSDMSDALGVVSGSSTSLSLDNKTLNNLMSKLGKEFSSDVTVYYQVKAGDSVNPSEIRNVVVSTEFGSFTDSRDNEVYPVTKVGDKYWMAENLRATKYSDGGEFYTDGTVFSKVYNDGIYGNRAGIYYSYGNAVRERYDGHDFDWLQGDSDIIQGVCPEGWHVATCLDFNDAIAVAADILGETAGDVFNEATYPNVAGAFRYSGDYVIAEGKRYTNELGLYVLPAGVFQPADMGNTIPTGYQWNVDIWTSNMQGWWDSYAFEFAQWNDFVSAWHYGNNPNGWAGAMPVRCVKNY